MSFRLALRPCAPLLRPSSVLSGNFTKSIHLMPSFVPKIPEPPGNIYGTVNDAYVTPPPDKAHGSLHWTAERIVSLGLVPLTIAPLALGTTSPLLDSALSVFLLIHCHAGFQSCIIDYIPKRVYGKYQSYCMYLLGFGSLVSAYGIYTIEKKEEGGLVGVVKKAFLA